MSVNNNPQEAGFTQSMKSLDAILAQFKNETLSLEEALKLFEEGVTHIKACQSKLSQAKGRVEELVKTLESDGEIDTCLFGEE